jgi:hypothetical protein
VIIVYRTGGTIDFKWQRVFDTFPSEDAAKARREEIERMGYPTKLITDDSQIPTTFHG